MSKDRNGHIGHCSVLISATKHMFVPHVPSRDAEIRQLPPKITHQPFVIGIFYACAVILAAMGVAADGGSLVHGRHGSLGFRSFFEYGLVFDSGEGKREKSEEEGRRVKVLAQKSRQN